MHICDLLSFNNEHLSFFFVHAAAFCNCCFMKYKAWHYSMKLWRQKFHPLLLDIFNSWLLYNFCWFIICILSSTSWVSITLTHTVFLHYSHCSDSLLWHEWMEFLPWLMKCRLLFLVEDYPFAKNLLGMLLVVLKDCIPILIMLLAMLLGHCPDHKTDFLVLIHNVAAAAIHNQTAWLLNK